MTPWKGKDFWISWKDTEWDVGLAASLDNTGTDYGWYLTQGGTMGEN